jgi:diphosphomevalonate decarboxylase
VSSEQGHTFAHSSPLNSGRIASLDTALVTVRSAIAERDLSRLGPVIEQDALAMHAVMMTGTPSLLYWQPGTLEVLQAVRRWREDEGLALYFTIDAGPNVHLLCEAGSADRVVELLQTLSALEKVIVSAAGPGPVHLENHLF